MQGVQKLWFVWV